MTKEPGHGMAADGYLIARASDADLARPINSGEQDAPSAPRGRELGQSQDDGVQGQAHAGPHHCAVDADELQITPQ